MNENYLHTVVRVHDSMDLKWMERHFPRVNTAQLCGFPFLIKPFWGTWSYEKEAEKDTVILDFRENMPEINRLLKEWVKCDMDHFKDKIECPKCFHTFSATKGNMIHRHILKCGTERK
uniref:Uncharacterized protein n=1 Tax=viral metagenome TaxID=1070528 RepID=A0A6M3XTW5_9ZZZZ